MSLLNIFSSKPTRIDIPAKLSTNQNGFDFFAKLLHQTSKKGHYILDFAKLLRVEANLYAVLGAVLNQNKEAKYSFENTYDQYVLESLIENNFIQKPVNFESKNKYTLEAAVPFREFSMKNETVVEKYIYDYILLSSKMPKMSSRAKRKIFRSIFEVYQNSVMHSGAESVFVCGHYYFLKKRLELTMVEIGTSFKEKVQGYNSEFAKYSGAQCIDWATKSGNTTKGKNETGGLGLDLIREFLTLNGGKLQIRSGDGYWEEKKGTKFVENCNTNFPGSIVNMEFNLYDTNSYYIEGEKIDDVKDIL